MTDDDISTFIENSAALVAAWHREQFIIWMDEAVGDSPIERVFWGALNVMAKGEYCDINIGAPPDTHDRGIWVLPQARIGRYKADFLIACCPAKGVPMARVIVELDGHAFHDRDQKQRSYEKRRDRELQGLGYKVLHFTGSDVVADPYRCAHEVLQQVGADMAGQAYDPADPMGFGA